jgi:hypothetical protein
MNGFQDGLPDLFSVEVLSHHVPLRRDELEIIPYFARHGQPNGPAGIS